MSHDVTPPENKPSKLRAKRVTRYLLVLFAAAFLLLLVSFLMQQRNHQVLVKLNDSITSAQEDLKTANGQLQLKLGDLEDQVTALEGQVEAAQREMEAVEWLRQLETALRSSHVSAKELLAQFQDSGLVEALPDSSPVEGAPSPQESYEALCRILG